MPESLIAEKGVLKLLKARNIAKAAGPDGIRPKVLKKLSSELTPILTLLFQASLHQQSLPDIWKHASVNHIYTKEDKTNPSNYRQVSLICISCKLQEHFICSSRMQHLTKTTFYTLYNMTSARNVVAKLSLYNLSMYSI